MQEAKDFLEREGERVERETEHYTTLAQMASASIMLSFIVAIYLIIVGLIGPNAIHHFIR
jgi:hypothetical protein